MGSAGLKHRNIGYDMGLDEILEAYPFRELLRIGNKLGIRGDDYKGPCAG